MWEGGFSDQKAHLLFLCVFCFVYMYCWGFFNSISQLDTS